MDTEVSMPGVTPREAAWQILAELPYSDLRPVFEEVRKLRHVMIRRFNADTDAEISFAYRGYHFRLVRSGDHIDILVNDPACPVDVLMLPLTRLISPLSRCGIDSHRLGN